jgi:hypothetical protein
MGADPRNVGVIASPGYVHATRCGDGSEFDDNGDAGGGGVGHLQPWFFAAKKQNCTADGFDGRTD